MEEKSLRKICRHGMWGAPATALVGYLGLERVQS